MIEKGIGWVYRSQALPLVLLGAILLFSISLHAWILFQFPYPPSNDAAGELYTYHAWLGSSLPQMGSGPLPSPVYTFAILVPFLSVFPPFIGIEWYIAFVSALVAVPAYFLTKEIGLRTPLALVASFMFGTAATFGLMVSWNAGSNLFGIAMLLLMLIFLARWMKRPTLTRAVFVALGFGLLAGSHPLTFVVGVVSLAVCLLCFLLEGPRAVVFNWKPTAILAGACVVSFLPFEPIYFQSTATAANVGIGSFGANLASYYQLGLGFAWGVQGTNFTLLAYLEISLTILGLLVLPTLKLDQRMKVLLLSTFAGPVALPLVQASNAIRLAYFLPIPFILLVAVFFEWLLLGVSKVSIFSVRKSWHGPETLHSRRRKVETVFLNTLVVTFIITVLILGVSTTAQTFHQSVQYYQELDQSDVAALNWIHQNVPANSTVFDGIGIGPWVEGLAERFAYSPVNLGTQVTQESYQAAVVANEISLGSYLVGSPELLFSQSPPAPLQSPEIFVSTPGSWSPLLDTEIDAVSLNVTTSSGVNETPLFGYLDSPIGVTGNSSGSGGSVHFTFWNTDWKLGLSESASIDGSTMHVKWWSTNATVNSVRVGFAIPPSGYFYFYSPATAQNGTTALSYSLTVASQSATLVLTGGTFDSYTSNTGWTYVTYNGGTQLNVSMVGSLSPNDAIVGYVNTSQLWGAHMIGYALVDSTRGVYGMLQRLQTSSLGGPTSTLVYESGTVEVFRVG